MVTRTPYITVPTLVGTQLLEVSSILIFLPLDVADTDPKALLLKNIQTNNRHFFFFQRV